MAVYPEEAWPPDAVIQNLDGTLYVPTGLPYIAKGTGPGSTPSYEIQYNRRAARLNTILAPWRQGMVVDEGGLKIGVYPVEFTCGGRRRSFEGATGVVVPDNTARVVYLDASAVLHLATDWPADLTAYLPLATVTSLHGMLTIRDRRTRSAFHVPSLEADGIRDRQVVSVHRATIPAQQADVLLHMFDPARDMALEEIQIFCSAVTAAAAVDIREAGMSVLGAPAVPLPGVVVKPAITDRTMASTSTVTVHAATDGTGTIQDLTVLLIFSASPAA